MRVTVKLPVLGDTTRQGMISRWLVSVGDVVERGQVLVIVEADKAEVEVPSPVGGTVLELLVELEDEIDIGHPIVVIESE